MHTVKPVRHVLRAKHLQYRDCCPGGRIEEPLFLGKQGQARLLNAQVHDRCVDPVAKQIGKSLRDIFAKSLIPAQDRNERVFKIGCRPAKLQPRAFKPAKPVVQLYVIFFCIRHAFDRYPNTFATTFGQSD